MTTTRIYLSTDSSAPVVTGQTGTLVNLLKLCLYGNGSGVAYGSKASAGWSLPFSDTSTKTVLRNSSGAGGTGAYFRILDDGSGTAGFREGFVVGYASMSDIDTGSDPCPTSAQSSVGGILRKSSTADGTARAWMVVADELTCYVWIEANATGGSTDIGAFAFGDFESDVAADSYRYFVGAKAVQNTTSAAADWAQMTTAATASPSFSGLAAGRGYTLTGTAQPMALLTVGNIVSGSSSGLADPAPGSSLRYVTTLELVQGGTIRGRLRGLYGSLSNLTAVAGAAAISPAPAGLPIDADLRVMPTSVASTRGAVLVESYRSW
jgi:hypothetical protein